MRPLGVPLWMLPFLSCCWGGRRKRWETVLSCGHPGCWLSDSGRKTATDPGRGSIARISNDFGPQDSAVDDGLDLSAAREHIVPRERVTPLTEASVPPVGTTVACARLDCSDSYVPDCWPPSAGVLVPPVGNTVNGSDFCVPDCFPELLESVRDMEAGLSVAGDVALPEVSPVVFCGGGCCAGVLACCC